MTGATAAELESVPTLRGDQTLRLLAEGYPFGLRRFERFGADAFRTRLAGQPVLFLRGAEAARFFYEGGRFTRTAALPPTVLHSLQDVGSVQTLDGSDHAHRKGFFLEVLDAAERQRMTALFRAAWLEAVPDWARAGRITLADASAAPLTVAACSWAGIPLTPPERERRTREFLAMIDGAGSVGLRNARGLLLRHRTERWAQTVLRQTETDADTVVGRIRRYREPSGASLAPTTASVELLNLLRPTVAVNRFIVFAALALHRHPEWAARFREGDETHLRGFVQEVRRCAPFFPLVGGRARADVEWQGYAFGRGAWVMLDIFATHRDGRMWADPLRFDPRRHVAGQHADALIAQGAGDFADGHRCPGEPVTVDLMEEAVRLLTRNMRYEVAAQDLGVDLRRFPTQPRSGFILTDVREA